MSEPLARYSFLPWMRQGIAGRVQSVDNLGSGASSAGDRPEVEVTLDLDGTPEVEQTVALFGPGDVIGLDRRAVARTDPRDRVTDFEPNYLASIDFHGEDFAWRYTPARAAGHRLRPWIALIVLTPEEFERRRLRGAPLAAIRVLDPGRTLPRAEESWAWAHVQVNRDLLAGGETDLGDALVDLEARLERSPGLALSRLVCPRRLLPEEAYHAFVVPTFETGRRAGLGEEIPAEVDGLLPAWQRDQQPVLPVYYEWSFRTGPRGDFEELVRRLEPRVLDPRIGVRPMDVQAPGFGVDGIREPPALGLEGALRTPQTELPTPWPGTEPFQSALAAALDLPEDLLTDEGAGDPVVSPPIHGRWHAAVRRVRQEGSPAWLEQLCLDPRNRAAAGLGTRVVQEGQEELVAAAWRQVGEVLEANRLLRQAQLSREISLALYRKEMAPLPPERLLSLTAAVHSRVLASPTTVRHRVGESRLPNAAVAPAFRRIARSRGPTARRLSASAEALRGDAVEKLNQGTIAAAPAKAAPARQIELDRLSDRLFPAAVPVTLRPLLGYAHWIVAGAVVLAAPFLPLAAGAALLVAGAAAFAYLERRSRVWRAAGELRESGLTVAAVRRSAPRPGFRVTRSGEPLVAVGSTGSDSPQAANFRQAAIDLHGRLEGEPPAETERQAADTEGIQRSLLAALDPRRSVARRTLARLAVGDSALVRARADLVDVAVPPTATDPEPEAADPIEPVMAHPDFPQPMFDPLQALSRELFLPNVELIGQNTIALLQTNQRFIESYMVGLNHEMARELLWRAFPTDQRGSYFRQFWDVRDALGHARGEGAAERAESLRDIPPIHTWPRTAGLGDNNNRRASGEPEPLVLVIRGDLLRKYPTAVIYALEARWPAAGGSRELGSEERYPLFSARIGDDITLLGFGLTVTEARGTSRPADDEPGWFFVIKERAGEVRFGLDVATSPASEAARTWDELSWGHLAETQEELDALTNIELARGLHNVSIPPAELAGVAWGSNAADQAFILFQSPFFVAVHASEMLPA